MPLPCILKDELYQMYVIEKKTDKQIAGIVGCHKLSIHRARKRYGINSIPKWSRHKCNPTQEQIDIIYGTLMGDGHLERRNKQRNSESCLSITHCAKQIDYLNWKYSVLEDLVSFPPKMVSFQDQYRENRMRYRFRTFAHPFFSSLRKEFYNKERKIITSQILNKLSPLSIAVWFMDDGTNIGKGSTLRFSTCSFSEKEHKIMQRFFVYTYGIRTEVSFYSNYPFLRINKEHKRKFIDLIIPYIPDCMQYKIEIENESNWWCNHERRKNKDCF